MAVESGGGKPHFMVRHAKVAHRHVSRLPPTVRGLMWSSASGFTFALLNTLMRVLAVEVGTFETQFLRYVFGFCVMLPIIFRQGVRTFRPRSIPGQFMRGGVHTVGLLLWFAALPVLSIADTTAISFTGPIFIMFGAAAMFGERMRWERWLAAGIGFAGVVIVVAPRLSGDGGWFTLVMLASSPVFALSYLITKALTKHERAELIVVWQAISVSTFSLPLALLHWQWPTLLHWCAFATAGCLGSLGHYLLTRSYASTDISATQSVKFLDLLWAAVLGWLVFADLPTQTTILGGLVISASTLWIARREARGLSRI